jgi:glutamyl-Q tRNA(Asp) synthetase
VKSSTATATTATADAPGAYRGRFAPSPSGALHLGSLVAALGSYLDARSHGGQWLLRIEDLDTPRIQPGAAKALIATLAALGLLPDGPVMFQSQRGDAYAAALARLTATGLIYPCDCPRRETAAGPYPGTCRNGPRGPGPHALRLRLPDDAEVRFEDGFQGPQRQPSAGLGDPVLRRRDGQIAYQLAVVVDDAAQGITDIVRGADLLAATGWQLQIRRLLGYAPVRHAHLPVVVEADGTKLSKSASAAAVAGLPPSHALLQTLNLLHQRPPAELVTASSRQILDWATKNWQPARFTGLLKVPIAWQHELGV